MTVGNHDVFDPASTSHVGVAPKDKLNVNSAAKYGVLGNIGRPVTAGGSVAAGELELTGNQARDLINDNRERTELMGCNAMDYHASLVTSLNNNQDHLDEYMGSSMGTYMLTTLLNSPAIASTFNTLEAFGGKRVQLMQDRCQAMQADATVSAEGMMRWQALQACVAENASLTGSGTVTDSGTPSGHDNTEAVAIAIAYRTCLYGSKGQDDRFDQSGGQVVALGAPAVTPSAGTSLEAAMRNSVLADNSSGSHEVTLWTGTLFHALRNTAFCTMEGGGAVTAGVGANDNSGNDCALMAAIPNVRWCAGSQRFERQCLSDGRVRMSRATFTPQQVFDLIFAFSEVELAYRDAYARSLVERVGMPIAEEIAKKGEVLYNPMVQRPVDDTGVQNRTDEMKLFGGCIAAGTLDGAEDFNLYIDRAIALDTTDQLDGTLVVDDASGATLSSVQGSPVVTPPATHNITSLIDNANIQPRNSATRASGGRMYSTASFAQVVADATRCVLKHHTRLSLMDHLQIAQLSDEEKVGALLAIRMNVAQTTTEMLYSHIKEKILFAEMDMQNGGSSSGSSATPPHVLATLETLVKVIDNQLEYMDRMKGRQQDMSTLLSVLRENESIR